MKIVITGSNGLLGQKLVEFCLKNKFTFLATSKGENRNPSCPERNYFSMDITNKLEINPVFDAFYPTHIFHTAAITNLDVCEKDPVACEEVNVLGTKYLFEACQRHFAQFIYLSTDFVFDGEKGNYSEKDNVNPIGTYAKSKVNAENLLMQTNYPNWTIVRTVLLFGQNENASRSNLVLWVHESLSQNKTIQVVNDQFRTPTWIGDLAWACLQIAKTNKTGIFHVSGKDFISIFDFALLIADFYKLDKSLIQGIKSIDLNQDAKRPPKTGFDITKAKLELNYQPKTLKEALEGLNL